MLRGIMRLTGPEETARWNSYGKKDLPQVSAMMAQLSRPSYARQWLKHKLS
jgi:hypothetical protein